VKDLDEKLKEAHDGWDHWGAAATKLDTQRLSLEKFLEVERNQLKAANAAAVAKDNQIQQLKTQLENAKEVETAALADLHGEGTAVIDNLQQQLDREKKAHEIVSNAHSSLRLRAFEIEQERDALKQIVLTDTNNNPTAIENATLRQQVTDLQRRLTDTNNHFNRQMFDLTATVNDRDQTIAGLNSKYKGYTPTRSTFPTVPQNVHDRVTKENTQLRQENLRLRDFQSRLQTPRAPQLSAQLQDEQTRRVRAEDRYNKLFPQIDGLRKRLRECEESAAAAAIASPPSATSADTTNFAKVIQLNNRLRANIIRNKASCAQQLVDLGRDRDQLFQRLSDIQRQGGDNELADLTSTVRQLTARNAELQAWKDKNEFMVEQANVMADAERQIAAAQGEIERAKRDVVVDDEDTGRRGTVRKMYETDGVNPPRKETNQLRLEVEDDEELFGGDETE
jgi:chromosome segregation ATPase